MPTLEPSRLDVYSTPDAAFRASERSRARWNDLQWQAFEERIYASGAADRAVLGIPDRRALALSRHVQPLDGQGFTIGAIAAAFQTAVENFARSFRLGWNAIRPDDQR